MRIKVIIIGILGTCLAAGSYFYYQYNYVQTLMLSEIVGKTDNSLANIAVNIFDFDTGLTRHDISQLKSKKDYWLKRTNEVESIVDPTLKQEESLKLINEMLEDPTMKKIFKGTLTQSSGLLNQILSSL
jgi:hypothetical protein